MMDRQAWASIRVMRLWKPHDLGVFLPPSHYPASHHEQDRFRERRSPAGAPVPLRYVIVAAIEQQ
jgi:hypothetical protein